VRVILSRSARSVNIAISEHHLITNKVCPNRKGVFYGTAGADKSVLNLSHSEDKRWIVYKQSMFTFYSNSLPLKLDEFGSRNRESHLLTSIESTTDALFKLMKTTAATVIIDDLIAVKSGTIRIRSERNSWLPEEAVKAKRNRRNLERKWKSSGCEKSKGLYRIAYKLANKLINLFGFSSRTTEHCTKDQRIQSVKTETTGVQLLCGPCRKAT